MKNWEDHPLTSELIEVSRKFGADPEYVCAGGGNSSFKLNGTLYIKPSGSALANLTPSDLVPLRLDILLEALEADNLGPGDPVRAAAAKAQVGNPERRPSVEILFHALIEDPLVLHLHPLTVNALTCSVNGSSLAQEILGDAAVFVDYVDPGVPLARAIRHARRTHVSRNGGPPPAITLLGNHGLVVSGPDAKSISERVQWVTDQIRAAIEATPPPPTQPAPVPGDNRIQTTKARLESTLNAAVATDQSPTAASIASTEAVVSRGPLIPDQIVYAGSLPMVVEAPEEEDSVRRAVAAYREQFAVDPVITIVPGAGVLATGVSDAKAANALAVFMDHVQVGRDAERLGGVRPMTPAAVDFIENWEAEAYRKQVS